ncbi:uncharacterized protein LOC124369617 [Homalodisca vitripennis]|uniref:uncharacterized protein LOC124369617 n=1 Tax=Homalodisca vitripennis TaxID=197043 RepID=UPI001EECD6D7|nr:uncharacterized protein LOC124369617 [Homalodisca vitripennis]
MFADDIKVFCDVSTSFGTAALQQSLINIVNWCQNNSMELNVQKCVVASFKRGVGALQHNYILHDDCVLRRIDIIRDLGVIMTPSLSPSEHIAHCTSRASSLLGFIFRSTRSFNSPMPIASLFKSLVRPILEYGSVIWSPYQLNHKAQLQYVQNRFIKMLGPRLGFSYRTTPGSDVESHFGFLPLHLRRHHANILFLFKLLNGLVDCPELLSSIDICVTRGLRSMTIFRRRLNTTNYSHFSGMSRLMRAGGVASTHLDFFNESVLSFRRKVSALCVVT